MMTKSTLFAIFTLFIGIVVGLPVTKDNEMDELVLRVNELRRMNPYQDGNRNIYLVRNLDSIGGGNLLRSVDPIGGGNLLRSVDPIGGGNLLRSADNIFDDDYMPPSRHIDSIGGGILLRGPNLNEFGSRQNLYPDKYHKRLETAIDTLTPRLIRSLDSIGGGNLVRALDSIGGGHLVKRTIDSIGGANLLKK